MGAAIILAGVVCTGIAIVTIQHFIADAAGVHAVKITARAERDRKSWGDVLTPQSAELGGDVIKAGKVH